MRSEKRNGAEVVESKLIELNTILLKLNSEAVNLISGSAEIELLIRKVCEAGDKLAYLEQMNRLIEKYSSIE